MGVDRFHIVSLFLSSPCTPSTLSKEASVYFVCPTEISRPPFAWKYFINLYFNWVSLDCNLLSAVWTAIRARVREVLVSRFMTSCENISRRQSIRMQRQTTSTPVFVGCQHEHLHTSIPLSSIQRFCLIKDVHLGQETGKET